MDPLKLAEVQSFIRIVRRHPKLVHAPQLAFFKEFLEEWGAAIPAQSLKSEPLPRPDASSGVVPKEASSGSKDNAQDRVVADRAKDAEEGPPMGDPGKEVQNVDRREAQEAKVLAGEAHQAGKLLEALELYNRSIQANPASAVVFAKRAQLLMEMQKYSWAIRDAERALELNTDFARPYHVRGRCLFAMGRYSDAEKDLLLGQRWGFEESSAKLLQEIEGKKVSSSTSTTTAASAPSTSSSSSTGSSSSSKKDPMEGIQGSPLSPEIVARAMQDPESLALFSNPKVIQAMAEVAQDGRNFLKYQHDPEVMAAFQKYKKIFG